ncbi:MAG: helix-turn-helix domain-containing protein, partial [Mediterranea sp.]|nr:helix-turn-helix domain-containing protein [Mediterranea sp.]
MKIKILTLTDSEQQSLLLGFRTGESHCFRMRCRAILLKSEGLSSAKVGEQTEMTAQSVNGWVK